MAIKLTTGAVLAACALLTPAIPAAEGWETNMKAAMTKAAKEGKSLLIDFTGSDWCGWCIRLDKEVFSQDEFKNFAEKKFVLVSLDFPRRKQLAPELKKQNDKWKDRFGVRGFPSIFLADAKGRPYAKTGYQRGGAVNYVKHLKELLAKKAERDAKFAQAAKAKGVAKAKLLAEAIGVLDDNTAVGCYRDIVDQIIALDPANKSGVANKYKVIIVQGDIDKLLRAKKFDQAVKLALGSVKKLKLTGEDALPLQMIKVTVARIKRDSEGAVKEIDKLFEQLKPTGQVAQNLWWQKALLLQRFNRTESIECLKKALKAAPEGKMAGRLKSILKRVGG